MKEFKDAIREARRTKGLTQEQLGKIIGVSSQVISNWERGYTTSLSPEMINSIARALDTTPDVFLGMENSGKIKYDPASGSFVFFFDEKLRDVFRHRLESSMTEKELTVQELSKLSEIIDVETCEDYLDGIKEPSLEHLIKLSQKLEVTTDYLLGQTPKITYYENKVLSPFVRLNNDNKDIVIGKAKDLLREQEAREYDESVAADSLKEAK